MNETGRPRICRRCKTRVPGMVRLRGRKQWYCSEQCAKKAHARRWRLKKFGLDEKMYERFLLRQGGTCAICKHPPKKRRLAVDHDHKTGKVRGLLCFRCNYALGYWYDRIELLNAAAEYLTCHLNAAK